VGSIASPRVKEEPRSAAKSSRGRQVAAVCYRIGPRGLEFLLVQTRRGRWTFPKGGLEPGLTGAQSAALEAFEEAGAHGRIEQMPFARYHLPHSASMPAGKSRKTSRTADFGKTVAAHLCLVSRLEPPQESDRKPTWFSPEKAKRRLRQDRAAETGAQLADVIERAVTRIPRLESAFLHEFHADGLRKVRFEAFDFMDFGGRATASARLRHFLFERRILPQIMTVEFQEAVNPEEDARADSCSESSSRKILQIAPNRQLPAGARESSPGPRGKNAGRKTQLESKAVPRYHLG